MTVQKTEMPAAPRPSSREITDAIQKVLDMVEPMTELSGALETAYLISIPGYMESIKMALEEPRSEMTVWTPGMSF